MWKEFNSYRIFLVHKLGHRFIVLNTNVVTVTSCKNNLFSAYSINREVKHHVYVKRQTWICTTWWSFRPHCHLLFIISTHKLVVSCNFLSIRIFLAAFICSFSILRNSQRESDVCRLRNLSNDQEKKLWELMKWWSKGKWFDLLPNLEQMIEISLYVDTGALSVNWHHRCIW